MYIAMCYAMCLPDDHGADPTNHSGMGDIHKFLQNISSSIRHNKVNSNSRQSNLEALTRNPRGIRACSNPTIAIFSFLYGRVLLYTVQTMPTYVHTQHTALQQ
jgi:hypothetical protein